MRRSRTFRIAAAVAALGLAQIGWAHGATPAVNVRLVAADGPGGSDDPGLADVLPTLRQSLRFESYRLVSRGRAVLQNAGGATLGQGYAVKFSGVEGTSVTVEVTHRGERVVRTRLRLRAGAPVVLGGFRQSNGTTLIVVLTLP